jgi:L-amino acid N-acyltransferase YncA
MLLLENRVFVRPSRDGDVEAMLAIYRRHIRRGVEDSLDEAGTREPGDLRDRRKNLCSHRLPHLVATLDGEVVGYVYVVLFANGRPIASRSSIRSISITNIRAAASGTCCCRS